MPIDYFKILQMARQPWLDEAEIRERFHRLAAKAHPDANECQAGDFSDLNQAWQTLRAPASRLRHFLELEFPELLSPAHFTTPKSPDLFMQISEIRQTAKNLSAHLSEARSPLTRALFEPRRLAVLRTIEELREKVAEQVTGVHGIIQSPQTHAEALAEALNELIFLEKWSTQLREIHLALE